MKTFHVCFSLGVNGYAVIEAESAEEAKAIFEKSDPMDLVDAALMPPDGFERISIEEEYERLTGSVVDLITNMRRRSPKALAVKIPRKPPGRATTPDGKEKQ